MKQGLLAALGALTCLSAAAQADQRKIIKDPFGFEAPMDAYEVRIPDRWQINGSVQWGSNPRCAFDNQKLHFVATDPATGDRIEAIPGGVWVWGSLYDVVPQIISEADCRPMRIFDARTFMAEYVPTIRPGANVLRTASRPDLEQKAMAEIDPRTLQPGQRPRVEVVQADLQYTQEGETVHETLIGSVLFLEQPVQTMYPGQHWFMMAVVPATASISSVNGKPDVSRLETVMESVTMLPAYEQRMAQYYQNAVQATAQRYARKNAARQAYLRARQAASASRTSTASSTGSDILDSGMESWRRRNAMNDTGQARAVDGIAERTPWTNTNGQTFYMPQQYQRVYQLPNDVYVGTNDPFFNPVQATGQFGTELGRPY